MVYAVRCAVLGQLPGRQEVFDALDRTLARPEFRPYEPSMLQRAWTWVQDTWREAQLAVLRQIAEWVGGDLQLGRLILIALLVVLAGFLLYAVWSMLGRRSAGAEGPGFATPSLSSDVPPRASERLRAAYELAQAGQYAEAMHALYQGAVLWLDEAGKARYEEGKTGGEYAREIEQRELRATFRRLLRAFYPVAYGGRPAVEAAWSKMAAAASSLGVPH